MVICNALSMQIFLLLCSIVLNINRHLKTSATILLLFFVTIQTFTSFVYDAAYSLNKTYVANTLCINKQQPQMHCDGKCFLAKEKQNEQKQDQQSNNTKREKFEVQPFFLPEEIILEGALAFITAPYCKPGNIMLSDYQQVVFHPPAA